MEHCEETVGVATPELAGGVESESAVLDEMPEFNDELGRAEELCDKPYNLNSYEKFQKRILELCGVWELFESKAKVIHEKEGLSRQMSWRKSWHMMERMGDIPKEGSGPEWILERQLKLNTDLYVRPGDFKDKPPSTLKEDLLWVYANMAYTVVNPKTAPSAGAVELLRLARKDKKAFCRTYLPQLLPSRTVRVNDREGGDVGQTLLDRDRKLLDDYKGRIDAMVGSVLP